MRHGGRAADYGCRRVDRVILTHFDDDHINGVEHLLARMGAENLTIPKAEGGAALDRLLELAERYGMDVETVTEETHLPFGNGELTIFPPWASAGATTGAHCAGFGGGA